MTPQDIQNEITVLEADNKAMLIKSGALTAAGSTIGLLIARQQKLSFWGKVGYFFAGATLARVPVAFAYSGKLANNTAKIQQLKNKLNSNL